MLSGDGWGEGGGECGGGFAGRRGSGSGRLESLMSVRVAAYRADCFGGAATIDDHIF